MLVVGKSSDDEYFVKEVACKNDLCRFTGTRVRLLNKWLEGILKNIFVHYNNN